MAESEKAQGKRQSVQRRECMIGSGTALAAGVLTVCASDSAAFTQSASESRALKLVHEAPSQEDVSGYNVNLAPPTPKTPQSKPGTPIVNQPASKS